MAAHGDGHGRSEQSQSRYTGTYDDVYKACWELLDAGVDGLAPEGSVPLTTKKEPLQAIAAAARDWSAQHRGDGQFVVRPESAVAAVAAAVAA